LDQNLEGLGDAGLLDVLALDDRLVHLDAAEDVVGLDGQEFLQCVSRTVGLERPHFHLTEALPTELCLTTQRLLRDHRVRAGRASVDLVVDQVVQLQDVHVADRDGLGERLTTAAVEQRRPAAGADRPVTATVLGRRLGEALDLRLKRSVEHRGRNLGARSSLVCFLRQVGSPLRLALDLPALLGDPPEVGLQHLAEVHATGDTERVEDDVDRSSVLKERHVFDRQDLRDDALVTVAASELVALGDLALLGDEHGNTLVDARAELVVAVLRVEHLDADDGSGLTVRNLQRGVADFAALLVEDGAQQALLGRQLGLTLRRDLADQDVAGANLGTDTDDAALVEVSHQVGADVRQVAGDLFL